MSKNKPLFEDNTKLLREQIENANKKNELPELVDSLKQGSRAWFHARLGKFTGSKLPDLMKKGRKAGDNWGETAKKVIIKVIIERSLTKEGAELYVDELFSKNFRQTEWGTRYEPIARELFKKRENKKVEETEFRLHNEYDYIGGSFDGEVIGEKSIIEIKCPYDIVKHQLNFSMFKNVPLNKNMYYAQIQGNMLVANADNCYFISFDPRRKEGSDMAMVKVPRDQDFIDELLKRIMIAEKAIYFYELIGDNDLEGALLLGEKAYEESKEISDEQNN